MIIVAEGAMNRDGKAITSEIIKQVLRSPSRLKTFDVHVKQTCGVSSGLLVTASLVCSW